MLAPKSHIPATLLGDIALAKGLAPKALEQYQFALSADPTHIPALEGLAKWARLTGDSTKAEQALRSGTRHGPRNWRTWHNLGVFFMEENRVAEALDSLETALGLAPLGEPAPLIALITAQLRDGQSGAALLRAEQLTKTAPEKAMAWFLRGRSHYDLNRLNEAEEDFRKAVLIDPDLIEARSGIGLVRATQGDTDSAVRIFRDVLKRDPDNLAARENLRRLGTIGAPSP
jgi:Flp pilus assembly protein TadD